MRCGISPFAASRHEALSLADRAVAEGMDTLWLGDGYLANEDFTGWAGGMESTTELAWLGGHFPTARLGLAAAIMPIRDPVWTAKQANTLERLAGGGFVLVATPGFWRADLEASGVPFDGRGAVFDQRLDRLVDALADHRYSPGPPDSGSPQLWLAGARATMDRAISRGLPFQSSRLTPEELESVAREYFDRGGTKLAHRVRVAYGEERVESEKLDWNAVAGSVEQLVDALARYREMGVSDLSIVPGQDHEISLRTIEVLGSEVLPRLAS